MLLVNPPSYITVSDFQSMPLDFDLSNYTTPQLQDIIVRASGAVNASLRKSLLATERTVRFYGNGTNALSLDDRPAIYVRKIQFVQPGTSGYILPVQYVLVDALKGELVLYSPLELQGIGEFAIFPHGLPMDVTYGVGYGWTGIVAPTWTATDLPTVVGGLTPGPYAVGVTTKTMWGETLPSWQTVTTVTGTIQVSAAPVLGAYLNRVFLAPIVGGNTSAAQAAAVLVAEIPAVTFGGTPSVGIVSSLSPPSGYYTELAPTTDSSQLPLPQEIREAVRLLAMQIIFEQNNLSNRGIMRTESGRKSITWRSTEGNSGRGIPLYAEQATALLAAHSFQEIF
jgi:hypothetical protein